MIKETQRFDLTDRVALVTGASRGLGRAVALGLAGAGARVACLARGKADLERLTEEISTRGGEAIAIVADVTEIPATRDAVGRTLEPWGRFDVLVNNAGVGSPTLALDMTEEEWDRTLDVNLKSGFFLAQAAAQAMLKAGAQRKARSGEILGRVVNISSMMGTLGGNRRSAYCASKGGLEALTRALAVEWARHPILVNAVAPGYFVTDMTTELRATEKFDAWVRERAPLRRWGTPDDLIGVVLFLASSASDYVTGNVIPVDGGWGANA
jgi:2-deoxy-D-gluconate 3-dehydrogenase